MVQKLSNNKINQLQWSHSQITFEIEATDSGFILVKNHQHNIARRENLIKDSRLKKQD